MDVVPRPEFPPDTPVVTRRRKAEHLVQRVAGLVGLRDTRERAPEATFGQPT
jgi:hypothetical protein